MVECVCAGLLIAACANTGVANIIDSMAAALRVLKLVMVCLISPPVDPARSPLH
jgi:hypothetical protein